MAIVVQQTQLSRHIVLHVAIGDEAPHVVDPNHGHLQWVNDVLGTHTPRERIALTLRLQ